MLLHFGLVLHFAAIVITFCVSITFCGDYYILRRNTPVYFNWNFLIYWSAVTNFKILRDMGRGENDVKDSPV